MIRAILRRFLFYTASLFITTLLLTGVRITGGIGAYIVAGVALTIMIFLLKPILNILSFPFNAITFGLFSFVVNAIILFLLTIFVPQISVTPFITSKITFLGFVIPAFALNKWFAYLVASLVVSGVYSLLEWVTNS
ncbi:MAG TPA: phage holin family protein [Patescibacteria group bacterium]